MNANPPPLPTHFHNRRTGLTLFGVLTVLLGGISGLLVPIMILGQRLAPAVAGGAATQPSILPAAVFYSALAVTLIWLGIGSIFAHRWARALLLIFSWSTLLMGLATVVFMILLLPMLPKLMTSAQPPGAPALPAGAIGGILIFTILFLGIFLVVIPGVGVLFYRSPHVKATCEARNPTPAWTDACPLPVLAVSLWLAAGIPMMLLTPFTYHAVLPFFGRFLTGWAGTLGYLVLAIVWAWAAWAMYRLDVRGWWLLVMAFTLFTLSNFITYSRHDLAAMYELMGLPAAQIAQMKDLPFMSGDAMKWATSALSLPMLGYLLFIRRYFHSAK